MIPKSLFFLIASLCLCNASPTTSLSRPLVPRDAVTDCQNVTAGLNESCWNLIPRNVNMTSWLNTWNKTTTTCKPGEVWANCFMREAGVTNTTSKGIRCDLIGDDVCPEPNLDFTQYPSVEISYAVASIWALQQYMTTLYQYLTDEDSFTMVSDEFFGQSAPRSSKIMLITFLNEFDDPVSTELATRITSPGAIGQSSFVIPTQAQAQGIVGQTVGYLLQWLMRDWADGGFAALANNGSLIATLGD